MTPPLSLRVLPVPRSMRSLAVLGLLLVGANAGCSDAAPTSACEGLLPGDVVISEVMANPSGADSGREWVEIYNSTSGELALAGLELVRSAEDGTGARSHVLATGDMLAAGAYYVLGGVLDAARPTYVDYGYGSSLGDLGNTAGRVIVRCGDRVLDEVVYLSTTDGASRAYDGALPPNATANDDTTRWCDSSATFSTGDFGSPGVRNPPCGRTAQGRCTEGGVERDVVPPSEGDLVITELHPNPNAVLDGEGEWFEVLALADVDLNGLELGKVAGTVLETLSDPSCLSVSAGTYLVFAANADSATNGGVDPVNFVADLALANSGGSLFVGYDGGVLDTFTYTSSGDGASTQLDPRHLSAQENDDEALWCRSSMTYGAGDRGTPGGANEQCMFPIPAGMCDDGGTLRAIVPPVLGDVVITELMPDSGAVSDTNGEWFEAYFASDADLNGLEMGTTLGSVGYRIQQASCLRVTAGSYVLLAKDAAGANGGLPGGAIDYDTLTLGNSATSANPGTLFVGVGGAVLDTALWFTSSAGVARSLDAGALDASANETESNWCAAAATDTYGLGDRGTPGAANPACPFVLPAGQCLDGGVPRAIVSPTLGDVVITEVMPDPAAVGDPVGEWFELLVNVDVDLNGLQVGSTFGSPGFTLTRDDCVHVTAGTYVLLANNADSGVNGGLPAGAIEHGRSLANDPGSLFVGIADTLLDQVSWTNSPTGASMQLDPSDLDPTTNDAFDTVACNGTTVYGAGDRGTPGAANVACPVVLLPGQCLDGSVVRSIVPPVAGDLIITEVMPDPVAVDDTVGEWFEVYVAAASGVDLNGLQVGNTFGTTRFTLTRNDCVRALPGTYVVFARNGNMAMNGGLSASAIAYGFALTNTGGALFIGVNDGLLDAVGWTSSPPGASLQLEPSDYDHNTNDAFRSAACNGTTAYGAGDLGTPGSVNNTCLDAGECWDAGVARAIVSPAVGQLYINEVMPNPATAESTTEWFELIATADVDLNEVSVSNATASYPFSTPDCIPVMSGEILLFARSTDPMSNGDVSGVDFTYGSVTMTNDNSMLSISTPATNLDTVTWGVTMNGRARSLVPGLVDPHLANDNLANWCNSDTAYGAAANMNFGTPGTANVCP
ncbi:MAG: lamin tail domain-containing protein [Sandaracinaceae bacterium]|nr:lamin tail domain-containing protein [Sandaracinaceae bacterium]